jgi:gamma-glutamylcyclotransferase (GGCT)/AIG2-like uncharacterized protein YtfP
MSKNQMTERCPDSRLVGSAKLQGYELTFPRKSKDRGCGVSSVERNDKKEVWGVVYKLNDIDLAQLDKKEGYKPARDHDQNSYNRIKVLVTLTDNDSSIECWTYIAVKQHEIFAPNSKYMEIVLSGARENNLPEQYIKFLNSIPVEN